MTTSTFGLLQGWMTYPDSRVNDLLCIADYLETLVEPSDVAAMYEEVRKLTHLDGMADLPDVGVGQLLVDVRERLEEIDRLVDGSLDDRFGGRDEQIESEQDAAADIVMWALTVEGHKFYAEVGNG